MIPRAVLLFRLQRSPRDLLLRELVGPLATLQTTQAALETLQEWAAAGAVVLVSQTDRWRLVDAARAEMTTAPVRAAEPLRAPRPLVTTQRDRVRGLLAGGPLTRTQIFARAAAVGVPESTAAKLLYELVRDGAWVRSRPSVYALPGDDRQVASDECRGSLGRQALLRALADGPLVLADLLTALECAGFTRGGARQIVQRAFEVGAIARPLPGVYERARVPRGEERAA